MIDLYYKMVNNKISCYNLFCILDINIVNIHRINLNIILEKKVVSIQRIRNIICF